MLRYLMEKDRLDESIEKNAKLIHELLEKIQEIDVETSDFFRKMDVKPEDVSAYLSNEENLSHLSAEKRGEILKKRDELENHKGSYRDVGAARKAYQQRGEVRPKWLYVK